MTIECVWMGHHDDLPEGLYVPGWTFFGLGHHLSPHYRLHVAPHRKPITVVIPDRARPGHGTVFCIDRATSNNPEIGWDVTVDLPSLIVGQRPNITVAPSIDAHGAYHGFLQGGVLTDDLGG